MRPASDGSVSPIVAPKISSDYRLFAAGITSTAVRLGVAPQVRLFVAGDRSGFYGRVRPLLRGEIRIQRQAGSGWRTVASAPVRADGTFVSQAYPDAGTYRARIVPASSSGYVAGASPVLRIVG